MQFAQMLVEGTEARALGVHSRPRAEGCLSPACPTRCPLWLLPWNHVASLRKELTHALSLHIHEKGPQRD